MRLGDFIPPSPLTKAAKRTVYQPLSEAPPAIAIDAAVPSDKAILIKRSFIMEMPTSP